MRFQVSVEMTALFVCLGTQLAGVRFLACVYHEVIFEVFSPGESFTTNLALMRFVPGVLLRMHTQMRTGDEPLLANIARERSFVLVEPHVYR